MAGGEERLDDGGREAFGVDHHRRSVHATGGAGQDRVVRCPCGLGPPLEDCCGRFLAGDAEAPTADRLMRSRYTAFVVGDATHLLHSWHPGTRPARLRLDPDRRWEGLVILATTGGGLLDADGTVTFVARHDSGEHHERSAFERHEGRWTYVGPVPD